MQADAAFFGAGNENGVALDDVCNILHYNRHFADMLGERCWDPAGQTRTLLFLMHCSASETGSKCLARGRLGYPSQPVFKWGFMRIEWGIALLSWLVILVAGCAAYKQAELASSPQCPDTVASPRERGVSCPSVPDEQRRETLAHPGAARIETRWQAAQAELRPRLLLRLAEDFVRDFPRSEYAQPAQVLILGARQALEAQRAAELSSDALQDAGGDAAYGGDLRTALRGDKDSAYRIALMYRHGTNGLDKALRRAEQWLRFAAELGNATASWEVAQIYSGRGQQGEAAHYEHRAVELGFRPPPRLSNRGY